MYYKSSVPQENSYETTKYKAQIITLQIYISEANEVWSFEYSKVGTLLTNFIRYKYFSPMSS